MRAFSNYILIAAMCALVGCSSTGGFALWPSNFPLLKQTKQLAAQTPVHMCLPRELSEQPLPDYFVEPGDRILVEPIALDSELRLTGDQLVQVDGSIDLGEFGRIRVAGLTVEMIEAAIADQLERARGKYEAVNVQLVETNAALFYVLGEVGSPGAYELSGRELVLDGILKAGGLTSQASPCNIVLVRPTGPCEERVVLPVCYRQITQIGDTTTNYQLQPGDRIVVAPRTFCEELAIWRQSRPCKCCGRMHCPECQPCAVGYDNRFTRYLLPFPLPPVRENESDQQPETPIPQSSEIDQKAFGESVEPPTTGESEPADQDFFLPPIKSNQ